MAIQIGERRRARSIPRNRRRIVDSLFRFVSVVSAPIADPLRSLASMPLTLAGFCVFDSAMFVANLIAGLAVTGVSLVILEYLIADE